jgi:hypothetical protein
MGHIELSAELQHTTFCSADQADPSVDTASAGATMVSERQQSGSSCSTSSSMSEPQPGTCERHKIRPSSVRSRAAFFEALNTPPSPNSPPLSPEKSSQLVGNQLRLVSRPRPCFFLASHCHNAYCQVVVVCVVSHATFNQCRSCRSHCQTEAK